MNVQRYARTIGILFVLSMVAGGFGEMYVPSRLIVAGDASSTARNITAFDTLFRLGFASYLVEAVCDICLTLLLYILLKPVNKAVALLAAFFGLAATLLFAVAEMFYFAPSLLVGRPAYLNAFPPAELDALVLLSLKFYALAAAIFMCFYGIAWVFRGYLIFRSGFLPALLGLLMVIGGLGFIGRNITQVLAPAYASPAFFMLMLPGGLLLAAWLLVKGVDVRKWNATREAMS